MPATNDRHAAIQRWVDAANRQPKLSPFERDTLGERMVASVEAWRGGRYETYDEAEKAYGVQRYRARRRTRRSGARRVATPSADPHMDNRTSVILFPGAHRMLKQWVHRLRKVGVHVNIEMLQHLAREAFEAYGDGQPVSKQWALQYMRRHPDMFPNIPAGNIADARDELNGLGNESSMPQHDHCHSSIPANKRGAAIEDSDVRLSPTRSHLPHNMGPLQGVASIQLKPCKSSHNGGHEVVAAQLCPCGALSGGIIDPVGNQVRQEASDTVAIGKSVDELLPKERAAMCQHLLMMALAGYM